VENEVRRITASSISARFIAVVVIFGCIYYASSVIITLICSVLIAAVLEPGVKVLERINLPRWMASLVMVLLMLGATYLLAYAAYSRARDFSRDLPRVTMKLRQLATNIQTTAQNLRKTTDIAAPSTDANLPTVRLQQESPWVQFLLSGFRSVYSFAVTVMFIPFLVFFMLNSKHQLWATSLNLFPIEKRQQAEDVIHAIGHMLRQFVVGNFLVGLVAALLITPAFAILHLRYAVLMGLLAAFLSLIPYIGVALGILPPLLVALLQFDTVAPFVGIAVTVMVVHFVAANLLTPKLVGHRVNLNALSVTLAMMFWGWLWGGIGLVLAVPITAGIKTVCDNVESLKPFGAWMSEG